MKFKIALTLFTAMLLSSCQKDLLVQDGAVQTRPQIDESKYFTPSAAYLASLDAYSRKPATTNQRIILVSALSSLMAQMKTS